MVVEGLEMFRLLDNPKGQKPKTQCRIVTLLMAIPTWFCQGFSNQSCPGSKRGEPKRGGQLIFPGPMVDLH
jgi:hypothetical protein